MKDKYIDIEYKKGEMEHCKLIEQVQCSKCGSHQLDIFIVEDEGMETTQAWKCRECQSTGFFGVSE